MRASKSRTEVTVAAQSGRKGHAPGEGAALPVHTAGDRQEQQDAWGQGVHSNRISGSSRELFPWMSSRQEMARDVYCPRPILQKEHFFQLEDVKSRYD